MAGEFEGVDGWARVSKKDTGGDVRGLIIPKQALKGAFEARGLTSKQFALFMGVSPSMVSEWVNGNRAMSNAHVFKAARLLGVSPALLLCGFGASWAFKAVRGGRGGWPTFGNFGGAYGDTYADMFSRLIACMDAYEISRPIDPGKLAEDCRCFMLPYGGTGACGECLPVEMTQHIRDWARAEDGRVNYVCMLAGMYPHDLRDPKALYTAYAESEGDAKWGQLLCEIDEPAPANAVPPAPWPDEEPF